VYYKTPKEDYFMKRIVLCLVVALVITGAAAAQDATPQGITGEKLNFSAVPTLSTEARYSAGRFGTDIDNFIGVNDYDPNIGTFFYLGGFPSDEAVDDTDNLVDNNDYVLSAGFAKTFKKFYAGLYYGGNLFFANGNDNGAEKPSTDATAVWNSNIALLIGTSSIGAFRLDLILDATDKSVSYDGKKTSGTGDGTVTALTWGKKINALSPHASLALRWPDYELSAAADGTQKTETTSNGVFVFKGGTGLTLDETSSLSADLTIQSNFGTHYKGVTTGSIGGPFWTFIDLGYGKEITLSDSFALGVHPFSTIGFRIYSPQLKGDLNPSNAEVPKETTFQWLIGLDLGAQYKATEKFTLYTGATLNVFDWVAWGVSGGDQKAGGGAWKIDGLYFDSDKWNNGSSHLAFGGVIAPSKQLSVGFGLTSLLDKLFYIDLARMEAGPGSFWGDVYGTQSEIDGVGRFFNGLTFDLTVSYKF
jgi:hypothetical protein